MLTFATVELVVAIIFYSVRNSLPFFFYFTPLI